MVKETDFASGGLENSKSFRYSSELIRGLRAHPVALRVLSFTAGTVPRRFFAGPGSSTMALRFNLI